MLPPFDPWLSSSVAADVAIASHADAAALAARQAKRLADLLVAAARGSRLYARLLKGHDPAGGCLHDLPAVHKTELMYRFDEWVTDPAIRLDALLRFTADRGRIAEPFGGRYVVWESSGSSGEPGVFVQDTRAMAVYDTLEALRRPRLNPLQRLVDPWYLSERIAFVGATGGHFASTVSTERLRRLHPVLSGSVHAVSFLQPLHALAAELHALAPTIIATYPSAAVLLAEEREAGRLDLQLREVWTGGETLSPAMRRRVQKGFGCPVANNYGASEFLAIAAECDRGRLHLNSDWVILEPVDDSGRAVPNGERGATTLLTNLANYVQPLIRYDIGDRVALLAGRCECGSSLPLIEVDGRCDDTLHLGAPGALPVHVLPLAVSTVLEDDAGLFDFQLVQEGPCELLLRTGLSGAAARHSLQRASAALAAFLAQQGVAGVHIHCHSAEPARRGRSGKIQRVVGARGGLGLSPG
jgi:phenylacetate-coenzyme A ligase PaaK-like adenylate-forming protein